MHLSRVAAAAPVQHAEFDDWVRDHIAMMRRVANLRAPGTDPDDVVQEALLRAWHKRATYDPQRGTPQAWLAAITADQARRLRRRWRVHAALQLDSEQESLDIGADLDLRRAIVKLSPRQRAVIVYFYYADLSVDDTAEVLHCAPGTVKSTLTDARRRLASLLEEAR